MVKGFLKADEQLKAIIKTKPFYVKFCGMFVYEGDVLVNQETEKAICVILRILPDNQICNNFGSPRKMSSFSNSSMWIPKSKLIKYKKQK